MDFDKYQNEQIDKGKQVGIDISKYADKSLHHTTMYEIRKGLLNGVDITPYLKHGRTFFQYREIRRALENGINPEPLIEHEYSSAQMKELRLGLQARADITKYANVSWDYRQMMEYRHKLIDEELNKQDVYYSIDKNPAENVFEIFTTEKSNVVKLTKKAFETLTEAKEHLSNALKVDNFYKRKIHILGSKRVLCEVVEKEKAEDNIREKYPHFKSIQGYRIITQTKEYAFGYSPKAPDAFVVWRRSDDYYFWGKYYSEFSSKMEKLIIQNGLNIEEIYSVLKVLDVKTIERDIEIDCDELDDELEM